METVKPHGGAYEKFPDSPGSYREAAWDGTVRQLFSTAVAHAEDRICWYDLKAGDRAKVAKRIRWWSLFLFALGTLAPILAAFLLKAATVLGDGGKEKNRWTLVEWIAAMPLAEIGYVLLAVTGAFVIFDQFFDASGSWIRFRQSQARLEVLLAEFRFAWAELMTKFSGTVSDRTQAIELVTLLRNFVSKVELLAEEETKEWARRFNQRIEAFDRNPNLKIKLDSDGGATGERSPGTEKDDASTTAGKSSTPSSPSPAGNGGTSASGQSIVTVRLAVDGAETLDPGSLQLSVDEASVAIPADGMLELPLVIGHAHRIVATGRRKGQAVRGELPLTATIDEIGKPLGREFAEHSWFLAES